MIQLMKKSIGGLSMAVVALLAACGGGGGSAEDPAPVTSTSPATPVLPTTGVYAGPITGFGSVIVNGTRFDTVGSSLTDDDGVKLARDDLKLGMVVAVRGSVDDSTLRGTASGLSLLPGTSGAITSIDKTADTLVLLGQTVRTNAATGFQDVLNFDALNVGDLIEVHGILQADGSLLATLIEKKSVINAIRVLGRVSGLDTVAKTFTIGTLVVDYSAVTVVGTLANGVLVKVKAAAGALSAGRLTASAVKVANGAGLGATVDNGALLKIKGVADAAPVNGQLTVSGVPVNASGAVFEGLTAIAAGQYIAVKGVWNGTTLVATKVEAETFGRERNELYGAVASVSTDASGTIVVVNGVSVNVSSATFEGGTLAGLAVGQYVEIKGAVQGNVVVATKVEVKSGAAAQGLVFEQSGAITDFVSVSSFKVNGMLIDASSATFFDGTAASLANGVYVEVKGAKNAAGTFVATSVEIKTRRG